MAKRGLTSTINAIAKEQAKAQKQREAEQKRLAKEQARALREAERAQALSNKADKQRYLEARVNEVRFLCPHYCQRHNLLPGPRRS